METIDLQGLVGSSSLAVSVELWKASRAVVSAILTLSLIAIKCWDLVSGEACFAGFAAGSLLPSADSGWAYVGTWNAGA